MNANEWQYYLLLVSCFIGRDSVSYLVEHATQAEVLEQLIKHGGMVSHLTATQLSQESFNLLEPRFSRSNHIIVGA